MDLKTAKPIRAGDSVLFEGKPYQVVAVLEEGLWAPYFELADVGIISHHIVELPEGKPARKKEKVPA